MGAGSSYNHLSADSAGEYFYSKVCKYSIMFFIQYYLLLGGPQKVMQGAWHIFHHSYNCFLHFLFMWWGIHLVWFLYIWLYILLRIWIHILGVYLQCLITKASVFKQWQLVMLWHIMPKIYFCPCFRGWLACLLVLISRYRLHGIWDDNRFDCTAFEMQWQIQSMLWTWKCTDIFFSNFGAVLKTIYHFHRTNGRLVIIK